MLHERTRHEGPGAGVDEDRVDAEPERRLHVGVQAVHDRHERLVRPRDREQEPDLLGDGLGTGPAL